MVLVRAYLHREPVLHCLELRATDPDSDRNLVIAVPLYVPRSIQTQ